MSFIKDLLKWGAVRGVRDPVTGGIAYQTAGAKKIGVLPEGWQGSDKGSMVFVRDHPYTQVLGDATHDSMHAWFKEKGVVPYSLTVNTDPTLSIGVGGSDSMTWPQVLSLQSDSTEITNHTVRHIGSLRRINTGFSLSYTGANATATAYVAYTTGVDPILHCVDSSDHTFDLTNASYDTLAELKVAVEALTGWTMTLAPELDGSELSKYVLGVAAANAKNCKSLSPKFAISGGIMVKYKGTTLKTAAIRCFLGNYIQILGDGIVVAEINLSNASYDTLAELATYINGLAIGADSAGDFQCYYMDAEGSNSYTTGVEATRFSLGGIAATTWMDCMGKSAYLPSGMPIEMVFNKLLGTARATALANGVYMSNFSDVGGPAPSGLMPSISKYNNLARVTHQENCYWPYAIPVDKAWVINGAGADDDTTTLTTAGLVAGVQAIADSPGFVISPFLHKIIPDGSSGKNFITQAVAAGYWSEAKCTAFLNAVKAQRDLNNLNLFTQQGFYQARSSLSKPYNRLFNSRLINSGETLTGVTPENQGLLIPGWAIWTQDLTEFAVADGVLTVTNVGNSHNTSNYIRQVVYLDPGKVYDVGVMVESLAYTSGTGVSMSLRPGNYSGANAAYEYESDMGATSRGVTYNQFVTNLSRPLGSTFVVPKIERKKAYIRNQYNSWDSDANKTWDLSSVHHIKLNIDALGIIEIDCAAGAASSSAVFAYEIAAAINAAIKASATYMAHAEYHSIARAENGYLILESPHPSYPSTSLLSGGTAGYGIVITAGTTTDCSFRIFGGANGDRPYGYAYPDGMHGMLHPYTLEIVFNAVGRWRLSNLRIQEVESVQ